MPMSRRQMVSLRDPETGMVMTMAIAAPRVRMLTLLLRLAQRLQSRRRLGGFSELRLLGALLFCKGLGLLDYTWLRIHWVVYTAAYRLGSCFDSCNTKKLGGLNVSFNLT